jgi:nucleoid DNA-binding protein
MTEDNLKKGQRIGSRNPKTGTEVPTSRVVVFKASAILNQRINRHNRGAALNPNLPDEA